MQRSYVVEGVAGSGGGGGGQGGGGGGLALLAAPSAVAGVRDGGGLLDVLAVDEPPAAASLLALVEGPKADDDLKAVHTGSACVFHQVAVCWKSHESAAIALPVTHRLE